MAKWYSKIYFDTNPISDVRLICYTRPCALLTPHALIGTNIVNFPQRRMLHVVIQLGAVVTRIPS